MLKTKLAVAVLGAAAMATVAFAQEPQTDRSPQALTGRDTTYMVFYSQPAMYGAAYTFLQPTWNVGSMHQVESLKTVGGAWQACDRHNFQGECRVLEGRYITLSQTGLREIRSMRPVEQMPAN